MLKITSIQANCGDSFLIEDTENSKTLLVDCGFKLTYNYKIKQLISSVDHLILTHSDEDHIHGAIPLIEDTPDHFKVGKVYVNVPSSCDVAVDSGNISIHQAITLENLLNLKAVPFQGLLAGETIDISENITLEVISPSQEDLEYFISKYREFTEDVESDPISQTSPQIQLEELAERGDSYKPKKSDFTNTASIAFVLKYKNYNLLFLGDAHPTVITDYLQNKGYSDTKKYFFDYIKLSHHGSITSISKKLISMISCSNFIVSTNGGKSRSLHPSRETLAKLALTVDRNESESINFYFNYPIQDITARTGVLISSDEELEHNIKLIEQSSFIIK